MDLPAWLVDQVAAVHKLLAQGMALKAISRSLQLNVKTVRKYARTHALERRRPVPDFDTAPL